jgi:ureidoacrylate peracid hydrolase
MALMRLTQEKNESSLVSLHASQPLLPSSPGMSTRQRVKLGISNRHNVPLQGKKSALLIVDIQKYLTTPDSPEDAEENAYFYEKSLPRAVRNIRKLTEAFRVIRDDPETWEQDTGCEVIFTYLQAATKTGRDISSDDKLSDPNLTNIPLSNCKEEDLFLDGCMPDKYTGKGDMSIPKTSSSVFVSTNLDYVLRKCGVEQVVVVGQLTDQCVQSAVRDAADLGYLVSVVEDACAANSLDNHSKGLQGTHGFCRIVQAAQVMDEIVDDLTSSMKTAKSPEPAASTSDVAAPITDAAVLKYLREMGLEREADKLTKVFKKGKKIKTDSDEEMQVEVDKPESKKMEETMEKDAVQERQVEPESKVEEITEKETVEEPPAAEIAPAVPVDKKKPEPKALKVPSEATKKKEIADEDEDDDDDDDDSEMDDDDDSEMDDDDDSEMDEDLDDDHDDLDEDDDAKKEPKAKIIKDPKTAAAKTDERENKELEGEADKSTKVSRKKNIETDERESKELEGEADKSTKASRKKNIETDERESKELEGKADKATKVSKKKNIETDERESKEVEDKAEKVTKVSRKWGKKVETI